MSTYDQLALFSRPKLYLSAPQTIDKSGANTYTITSNLSATAQAIIYGSTNSYLMNGSNDVQIDDTQLLGIKNSTIDFVLSCTQPPEQEFVLATDDANQNQILIGPGYIALKLFFDDGQSQYSNSTKIRIKEWQTKKYVVLQFSDNQATLNVNGITAVLKYSGTIITTTTATVGGSYSGFEYLLDGFGLYVSKFVDKSSVINDPGSNHAVYAAADFGGRTTLFDTFVLIQSNRIKLSDFYTDVDAQTGDVYRYTLFVPNDDSSIEYLIVRPNDIAIDVTTMVNFVSQNVYRDNFVIDLSTDATIVFTIDRSQVDDDFELKVDYVSSANVSNHAALLIADGNPLFPVYVDESLVNIPKGVEMQNARYSGMWYVGESDAPKSIEIMFMPTDDTVKTYVFYSSDGEASFGPGGNIVNFTAYLNGEPVTTLSSIRLNQWNHLVLTLPSEMTLDFFLNGTDISIGTTEMEYLSITAYDDELIQSNVDNLYAIATGYDKLSIDEPTFTISEGSFTTGEPFRAYSYAWSILSGGGN